jgi:hypothetical protein
LLKRRAIKVVVRKWIEETESRECLRWEGESERVGAGEASYDGVVQRNAQGRERGKGDVRGHEGGNSRGQKEQTGQGGWAGNRRGREGVCACVCVRERAFGFHVAQSTERERERDRAYERVTFRCVLLKRRAIKVQ